MSKSKDNDSKIASKAVAMKYTPGVDNSPIIVASGYGNIAEKIIHIADETGIPVFRDSNAVSILSMLEVGSHVPPELFELVAAIYINILEIANSASESNPTSILLSKWEESQTSGVNKNVVVDKNTDIINKISKNKK